MYLYYVIIHWNMNSTIVQNPRRNSYAGSGCRHYAFSHIEQQLRTYALVSAYCKGVAEKDPLVSRCEAMPKAGPSPLEWKRRLEAFAQGEYAFSTGQKPRKGSRWHKVLCAIEDCPRQGKPASAKDPFGKPLVCKCGYHKISTKVSKTCR